MVGVVLGFGATIPGILLLFGLGSSIRKRLNIAEKTVVDLAIQLNYYRNKLDNLEDDSELVPGG